MLIFIEKRNKNAKKKVIMRQIFNLLSKKTGHGSLTQLY